MLKQILGIITLFILVFGAPLIYGVRCLVSHVKCKKAEKRIQHFRNREA